MALAHQKLVVWQRADDLFIEVHRITRQCFPLDERFELGRQVRRSAYSVSANIVEGSARDTVRETLRFLTIASASLNETGYGLHAAHRLGYVDDALYASLETQLNAVGAPLHGLIRQKRKKLAVNAGFSASIVALAAWHALSWLA